MSSIAAQWLRSVSADDPALFERRLAWDGIDVNDAAAEFARAWPVDADSIQLLRGLLAGSAPVGSADADAAALASRVCFVELWQRLAEGAWARLITVLDDGVLTRFQLTGNAARGEAVKAGLIAELVSRLAEVGEGVLWVEFNARRPPDQAVFAHLGDGQTDGAPRRGVYLAFLEELRTTAMAGLLSRYPVLGRHLVTVVGQWTSHVGLLLGRCHQDLDRLVRAFGMPPDVDLAGVSLGLSDPHRGGQSVAILEFVAPPDDEIRHRVVYKPKDLSIDEQFHELLATLPRPHLEDPALGGITVLPRDGYGWMEYVPHKTCQSDSELAAFYRYAGRLTAALHVLGGTDCHHENLIANGGLLHLVDAETLLGGGPQLREDDLTTRIALSVTAIGILPQWHVFGRRRLARDVSALGVAAPPARAVGTRGWQYRNTDAMVVGIEHRLLPVPTSSPVTTGQHNRVGEFLDELASGFAEQLAVVAQDRDAWLATGGHLDRFADLRHRVVLRPTWIYLWLRQQQLEPDALRSPFQQRLVLEGLARSYVSGAGRPDDWPLFGQELAQMAKLDIPFFEMGVGLRDLTMPDGSRRSGYFQVSGLDTATAKLIALDADAIAFQVQLLRGAVISKDPRSCRVDSGQRMPDGTVPDALSEAELIADHLLDSAISHSQTQSEWLGSDVLDDMETYRFGPLGLSLYSGRVGVALFLAAASGQDFARSSEYAALARRALAEVPEELGDPSPETLAWFWHGQPLGIAGAGGILLGIMLADELLPGLAPVGGWSRLLAGCDESVLTEDDRCDMVFGLAGLIGPLLVLGTPDAVDLASRAGRALLRRQEPVGSWRTDASGSPPLSGFSHGASGLAAALAALGEVTGELAPRDAACRALRWERSTMDAQRGSWPDLRRGRHGGSEDALSWCHGPPGIALARLCLRGTSVADSGSEQDLRIALTATADPQATPFVDSLCCGRLGRSAILRAAARQAGNDDDLAHARRIEARVLADCGERAMYASVRSPGLFQGMAGVGLAMLDSVDGSGNLVADVLSTGLLALRRTSLR
ncbi:MAG: type 2 lantipeptide synthetase LanM [Actinomycetales bacterium]|nr:type 2 lantipeptide synthetase LanM [Actinomycetales bacterium]